MKTENTKFEIPLKYRKFSHPAITKEIQIAVNNQLKEDISIYDNGGIYKRFEDKFQELFKTKYTLAVNSGTTALFSMYYGVNLKRGDEVIVPSYTFFATVMPLFHFGVIIKYADCLDNGNISPKSIENLITNKTKAIVVTHMWGIPCDMDEICKIAQDNNILILEDSSHAHGATYKGKEIGSFSDGSAWSFQGKKNLTTGEGGVFATKHQVFFERAVLVGHFNKRAKKDVLNKKYKDILITGTGLNLRMHPLGAAIGLELMKTHNEMVKDRQEVADYMIKEINSITGLSTPRIPENSKPAWYAFPIIYDNKYFNRTTINDFVDFLDNLGAYEADIPGSTCPLFNHHLIKNPNSIFKDYPKYEIKKEWFTNAYKFHSKMFKLPTWYGDDRMKYAKYYIDAIRYTVKHFTKNK